MSSSNPQSQQVLYQWDVGFTGFGTVDKLVSLLKAASKDNVQAQAIRAAEALGNSMIVSEDLIGPAVTALGGNKNIRIEAIKVNIGLQSGGVSALFRESAPLVRSFLLMCACKLWLLDREVGDLLHEITIATGLISHFPVSADQMGQLVGALSSHAYPVLPVDFMHRLAVDIDNALRMSDVSLPLLYTPLEIPQLARVLSRCMDAIRNEDVETLELRGCVGAVWLGSTLCWLFPDSVSILSRHLTIRTATKQKILIRLQDAQEWNCEEWACVEKVERFIEVHDRAVAAYSSGFPGVIPMRMTKAVLCSETRMDGTSTRVVGEIACAMIRTIVGYGYLIHLSASKNRTWIHSVCDKDYLDSHESLIASYGWDVDAISDGQRSLYEILERSVNEEIVNLAYYGEAHAFDSGIISPVRAALAESGKVDVGSENNNFQMIITTATFIVAHALSLSTICRVENDPALLRLNTFNHRNDENFKKLIGKLLCRGLPVSDFLDHMFTMVHNTSHEEGESILAMEDSGQVLFPVELSQPSFSQRHALLFAFAAGSITKNGYRYTRLVEGVEGKLGEHRSSFVASNFQLYDSADEHAKRTIDLDKALSASTFENERYKGTQMVESTEPSPVLKLLISGSGTTLKLQTRLENEHEAVGQRYKTWRDIMARLATAIHMPEGSPEQVPLPMIPQEEENLARQLQQSETLHRAFWIDALLCQKIRNIGGLDKILLTKSKRAADLQTHLFAALSVGPVRHTIIQHDAHLLRALETVNEFEADWGETFSFNIVTMI